MELDLQQIQNITLGAVEITREEDGFHFFRFTRQQRELYRRTSADFHRKTFSTSGVQLRFTTDSSSLSLKVQLTPGSSRRYFSVDVLVDGEFFGAIDNIPQQLPQDYTQLELPLGGYEKTFHLGHGEKTVSVVFPWSVCLVLESLELDDGALVLPVKPAHKLLAFGDSITHGYDALRPSNKYITRIASALDAQELNKGIGGEQFFPELAASRDDMEPDYITVAYGTNDWSAVTLEAFRDNCTAFLTNLRKQYPNSRILVFTPIWRGDWQTDKPMGPFCILEQELRAVAEKLKNVTVIQGFDLVPGDKDLYADLWLHPNDQGFDHYYHNLLRKIEEEEAVLERTCLKTWQGARVHDGVVGEWFPATVPGNIQQDYGNAMGFPDVNFGDNCKLYEPLEDDGWLYRTEVCCAPAPGERVFFVTKGIEYEYEVRLNGKKLAYREGMFSPLEIDITDELANGNVLEVYIYPHPKREGAAVCRDQADQSCKPAVEYNWDWHPRLLVSGLWNDTYIETRGEGYIARCEVTYELDSDLKGALVNFDLDNEGEIQIFDPQGKLVYQGTDRQLRLENVQLWWCAGQGEPNLYRWKVTGKANTVTGTLGLRRVKLVMNGGAWEHPSEFPKSRSTPPITIELNGRRIFAKGSNWVNPELFTGKLCREIYEKHLKLVKAANMNILRCWGGAVINKDAFYEICDELGVLVWQEFPLACNNYKGSRKYLKVLEQEATAIIKRLRQHPCLALWCGGNELFNNWSKMTDQSFALRLLNKLCYELDWNTPFIPTAPVMGMGHGHYAFLDLPSGQTVFEMFRKSNCTAYSEFGVPSIASMEILREVIPAKILHTPMPNSPWETHKGYGSWNQAGEDSWLCMYAMDLIFGKQGSLEAYVDKSNWLQCEGLKCIFEEARRQKPHCSMALNWCFDEPWNNVAGPVIVAWPCRPKPAYYAVTDALRPVMPSAAIPYFSWESGSLFTAELWLLNDSPEAVSDTLKVYLETDGTKQHILDWNTGCVPANENKRGHVIQAILPDVQEQQDFFLVLESNHGTSRYRLHLKPIEKPVYDPHALNV